MSRQQANIASKPILLPALLSLFILVLPIGTRAQSQLTDDARTSSRRARNDCGALPIRPLRDHAL